MTYKTVFGNGNELVLATCSNKCVPNVNVVISLGFDKSKLLIADCQMKTTLKNLKETKKICVFAKKEKEYYRMLEDVELFTKGSNFKKCVAIVKSQDATLKVKHAILITPKQIYNLENQKNSLNKIESIL